MEIKVTTKAVYGEVKIYPACAKSEIFAQMAGTKTLTTQALKQIRALGYTVVDATVSALAA